MDQYQIEPTYCRVPFMESYIFKYLSKHYRARTGSLLSRVGDYHDMLTMVSHKSYYLLPPLFSDASL